MNMEFAIIVFLNLCFIVIIWLVVLSIKISDLKGKLKKVKIRLERLSQPELPDQPKRVIEEPFVLTEKDSNIKIRCRLHSKRYRPVFIYEVPTNCGLIIRPNDTFSLSLGAKDDNEIPLTSHIRVVIKDAAMIDTLVVLGPLMYCSMNMKQMNIKQKNYCNFNIANPVVVHNRQYIVVEVLNKGHKNLRLDRNRCKFKMAITRVRTHL